MIYSHPGHLPLAMFKTEFLKNFARFQHALNKALVNAFNMSGLFPTQYPLRIVSPLQWLHHTLLGAGTSHAFMDDMYNLNDGG